MQVRVILEMKAMEMQTMANQKKSPRVESENQDDDKLDDSKYKKTVDDIQANYCGALPNFRGHKSNADPSSVRECPAETTSETTDRGVQDQRCTAISMSGAKRGKICSLSGCLKNHIVVTGNH